MLRPFVIALAVLAVAAPAAAAHDAEIFATNNTAVITDPKDPRLKDRLERFARGVERIIDDGGARPRGSELLDGVFAGDALTFERSRRFDVDRVSKTELHDIAETVRRRFLQQSVLTFDPDGPVDAIELEVPGVSAKDLREGLQDDPEAAGRLFGGSVTLDRHLILVAALEDAKLARSFAKQIGGDLRRAKTRYGDREFVDVQTGGRARIEHRTLVITGTPEDDTLRISGNEIDFGDDGVIDFEPRRFHRIRIDLGDGVDRLIHEGTKRDDRFEVRDLTGVEYVDVQAGDGDDRVTIDALEDLWEVHADLGAADGDLDRVTVHDSDEGNQSSIGNFGRLSVLADVFVTLDGHEPTDRLRLNGNGGDDILSASTDLMDITLDGGADMNVILGGPGDDTLIGGPDFDDIKGGRGDDIAYMGADFDRFSWAPGDGSDTVDGGPSRDSLSFLGSADAETFELSGSRFTRDVVTESPPGRFRIVMDLDHVEVVDAVAGAGADTFRVRGDADVGELNTSLQPGNGAIDPDRVEIEGTEGDDHVAVTGKKVVWGSVAVTGLPVKLGISFAQIGIDTLAIDTLGGDDSIDTSGLGPDVIDLETK
jgi:Ca2+-binding RTX toxin-like protein